MDEDTEGHELTLGLVAIDCELSGESVLVDVGFFELHHCKRFQNKNL